MSDATHKGNDPDAIRRANAKLNQTQGYGFGNLGDSVERRYTGYSDPFGGHDALNGIMGAGTSVPGLGAGNYFGPGLGFGNDGRGFGPYHVYGRGAGPFTFLRGFSGQSSYAHNIIARCILTYVSHGMVKNIVDIYADFTADKVQIVHEDESVENFFAVWRRKVNLDNVIRRIATDYYLTGSVFAYRVMAQLTEQEKRDMKRGKAEQYTIVDDEIIFSQPSKLKSSIISPRVYIDPGIKSLGEDIYKTAHQEASEGRVTSIRRDKPPSSFDIPENKKRLIPWDYISLNPLQIEPRGKKFKGERYWAFGLSRDDTKDVLKVLNFTYRKDIGVTEVNFPKEFKGRVQKYQGRNPYYVSEVRLDYDNMAIIQDRKFDYWDWAVPFVWPALRHIQFKDILMNMDIRVATSVINTVTLWKLGDRERGVYPEDEMFERLADMLQQPGQAVNLIWNQDIDAEVVEPNLNRIFDPKKYEAANRDIMIALGLPEVLLGGKGSNFSNSFIGVATVLERMQTAREQIETWLMRELKIITDAMGFRKLPQIRWSKSNLRDKKSEQQLILQLFDRGIVSAETALNYFDEDVKLEVERMLREKDIADKNGKTILEKRGPYNRPEEMVKVGVKPVNWESELKEQEKEATKQQQQQQNDAPGIKQERDGRPPGSKDKIKREPKTVNPQGQNVVGVLLKYEKILAHGEDILNQIDLLLTQKMLNSRGVESVRNLSSKDKQILETMILNTFSHFNLSNINHFDSTIAELLYTDAPAKLDRCVSDVTKQRVADFRSRNNREPNKEEKRKIVSSAWAICRQSTNL